MLCWVVLRLQHNGLINKTANINQIISFIYNCKIFIQPKMNRKIENNIGEPESAIKGIYNTSSYPIKMQRRFNLVDEKVLLNFQAKYSLEQQTAKNTREKKNRSMPRKQSKNPHIFNPAA